jgi:hypothetical protein
MGPVCAQASTAYANWLQAAFPQMMLFLVVGSTNDMVQAVRNGQCDGIIDTWPNTLAAASNPSFCDARLAIRGEALRFGPQDIAVGVRNDLADVELALSYWIQQLRSCSPTQRGSPCYNSLNMNGHVQAGLEQLLLLNTCPLAAVLTRAAITALLLPR